MSYTQLYDPVTPQEALSGANIAFRGYGKSVQPNSLASKFSV